MPVRMRAGTDTVSGAEKERFDVSFEDWYARTATYGGTREEYDRLWAHYHPGKRQAVAWIVEIQIDDEWEPLWGGRVLADEESARDYMASSVSRYGDNFRVREYVRRQED